MKKTVRILLLACALLAFFSMPVHAAPKKGWVRKQNKWYYYVKNKPVKGRFTIGNHEYYFDSKGVQKTSWRKIGNDYYCYRSADKAGGYLLTNTVRNGIRLGADGRAVLSSDRDARKAAVMVRVSTLMDRIIGKNKKVLGTKTKKLKACFDYLRKKYPYRYVTHFRQKDPDFDLWCVEAILKRGYADCHLYSSTFAYLANALGYSNITIFIWNRTTPRPDGHSWVQIGRKVYDVSHARFDKTSYELFAVDAGTFKKKYHYYFPTTADRSL